MHKEVGNVGMSDGSAQQVSPIQFQKIFSSYGGGGSNLFLMPYKQ
jgi:hypothetical protein